MPHKFNIDSFGFGYFILQPPILTVTPALTIVLGEMSDLREVTFMRCRAWGIPG